ncbi:MAG: hypothetical protein CMC35_01215 [Flavobacteriaceae bacterium]|nr:hypothetical protein [Flavobacteriaceae bacterium]|tara:strand:+ start:32043 stop:33080 length:1038 start_codon:yes stop_codon:yes gene_type:complete
MKYFSLLPLFFCAIAWAQQPYYDDVDLTLTGQDLYFELQQKIDDASSSFTYGDIRDTVKETDEDPSNSNNVLLVFGYNDSDGNCTTDRSRDKDDFGGLPCEYNREHVFARGNANPDMGSVNNGTTGIGADPHNLRPSDQQMNNNKGNRKLASGSGNAGVVSGGNWYPGDEWKGDVARMMMYMYTRYGDRCLPSLNGVGATQGGTDMLQIYLQWNVDDPVSDFEDQRNPYLETVYGNRNPFIDNPYLATIIWGGPTAEDRWDLFDTPTQEWNSTVTLYPNPANDAFWVTSISEAVQMTLYDMQGRVVLKAHTSPNEPVSTAHMSPGMYLVQLTSEEGQTTRRIIIE